MRFFFSVNIYYSITQSAVGESIDAELQIWSVDYKVIFKILDWVKGSTPLTPKLFQGQLCIIGSSQNELEVSRGSLVSSLFLITFVEVEFR